MLVYKLTYDDMMTSYSTQWELNVPKTIRDANNRRTLCNSSWFHFFTNPVLGWYNKSDYENGVYYSRLFLADASGEMLVDNIDWLKGGCKTLTLLEELELPQIDRRQMNFLLAQNKLAFNFDMDNLKRFYNKKCGLSLGNKAACAREYFDKEPEYALNFCVSSFTKYPERLKLLKGVSKWWPKSKIVS